MQRITITLSGSDLATLDRLRGRTDRSTYLRRLLRRAGRLEGRAPDEPEDDSNGVIVSAERFERLRALTGDQERLSETASESHR